MTQIVFLGAGSVVFARQLTADLLRFDDLPRITLVLHDIDADRLRVARETAEQVSARLGRPIDLVATLDRREALRGANFVINMMQVGGIDATRIDLELPARAGLRQTIGDTTGVGGVFRALRTFPVLSAIAAGNHTETKMAAVLGRDRQALSWPLGVLVDAGFVVRDDDALRQRRPAYRIAEPIVRFQHVVTRRDLARFEERRATEAWADAQARFATHVLGPHFEDLARNWTIGYASEQTTGGRLARVGATQVNDPAGRSQAEVDIVGIRAGASPKVGLLGEAKFRTEPTGVGVLAHLERARDLLTARVAVEDDVKLLVFSASGFDRGLLIAAHGRSDVELVDLDRLYVGE